MFFYFSLSDHHGGLRRLLIERGVASASASDHNKRAAVRHSSERLLRDPCRRQWNDTLHVVNYIGLFADWYNANSFVRIDRRHTDAVGHIPDHCAGERFQLSGQNGIAGI